MPQGKGTYGSKMGRPPKVKKKNMGGSMGGGMNPRGYSKDPTVESIVGYNPNRMNKGGVAGRLAKRGYGKAK